MQSYLVGVGGYILTITFFFIAFYNTPHYNMDLDINWSCLGFHFFYNGILQRNCMKMTIAWPFCNSCVKLFLYTVKPALSGDSKRKTKIIFQGGLSHYAGQKYCRMLQGEHSAILLTFIKLPFVSKTFILSIFEWPLKTSFTVTHFICAVHSYGPQTQYYKGTALSIIKGLH